MVRVVSAVLSAFVLSLALVGCGEKSSEAVEEYEPHTQETLLAAMTKAVEAHPTVRVRFEVPGTADTMDFRVRMGTADEFALAGKIEGDDPFEMVVVDGDAYTRDPGDERYLRLPDDVTTEMMNEIGDMSPKAMIDDMRRNMKSMRYVGVEAVDGDDLHRYDVVVSSAAIARELGSEAAKHLRLTYRMWLDEDDLIREIRMDVMGSEIVATMSEWGEPVEIEAPPASKVEQFPGA